MGRLGVFSGKEVCSILARHGFMMVRQRGSHVVMQRQIAGVTTTVPVPLHSELRIGTLQAIIRQSGIDKSEFEV
ncbi:MAG: type II toxin-antitoxin system HicA family toxin [Burkholderiaceae bacterium]